MKYGCIGEHLGHSFSREIHAAFADYPYELCELAPSELRDFMRRADFSAINVTIPYKSAVMPYLDGIDDSALQIGAVNTVVNRGGRLYGYNTDFFGMRRLLAHAGISLKGKKVLILGTGGTSKTAFAVAEAEGAVKIIKASRKETEGAVLYTDVYKYHTDAEIIINTTPVGMYPNIFDTPIDISRFDKLSGVVDAIYNPLKTPLVLAAERRGIPAMGGLFMLVAQAVRASEYFLDTEYDATLTDRVYEKIAASKRNIVLIGMPASGKSTVGKIISDRLCRPLIDTDAEVERVANRKIPDIFASEGEGYFRDLEADVTKEAAARSASVIATGGGLPKRAENIYALSENGRIYFIDRPLASLIPTKDRPLSSTREAIEARYRERYGIYCAACDVRIDATGDAQSIADMILTDFFKNTLDI